MTAADGLAGLLVLGIVAYAVTAGADLGAGIWHLLDRRSPERRGLVIREMGPVWEANQVWLVFVLITLFSGFPIAFGRLSRGLFEPLALVLLALAVRGAAYVFQGHVSRGWSVAFGVGSLAAPALLGAAVASTATGRLEVLAPLPLVAALLAVLTCAHLAAVYLCRDAARDGLDVTVWRRRAVVTAVAAGGLALGALPMLRSEAPVVADGLAARSLPMIATSVAVGLLAVGLLRRGAYRSARVAAAAAPAALLVGWGLAQHPWLVAGSLPVADAVPAGATAGLVLAVLLVGFAVVVPSLMLMIAVFQRPVPDPGRLSASSRPRP